MSSTLSHKASSLVTLSELAEVPTPSHTYSWRPVPHIEIVNALLSEVKDRGFQVTKEQYAVARAGQRLFGTMDLEPLDSLGEGEGKAGLSIGFRNSHDKTLAASLVAGHRVFVCDNLILSGEAVLMRRKHSWGWSLVASLKRAFDVFQERAEALSLSLEKLSAIDITGDQAKAKILDASMTGVMPKHMLAPVYEWYFEKALETSDQQVPSSFEPRYPDVAPRTMLGLHNAFTRAFKGLHPASQFETTSRLGSYFAI